MDHIYTLGIDIGSTASKCIMLADGKVLDKISLVTLQTPASKAQASEG